MRYLTLSVLGGTYAICRMDKGSPVPGWALAGETFSVTRTRDELSVVCREDAVPGGVRCDRGWRCFRVEGPLPFDAVGVIASISAPLAKAGIPIFVFSTYDTDYVLVKDTNLEKAISVMSGDGHKVMILPAISGSV